MNEEIPNYERHDLFGITVEQQGNRLKHYRLADDDPDLFTASSFFIGLFRQVNEDGENTYELIKSEYGQHFKLSMIIDSDTPLPAGRYIIALAPQWNASSHNNDMYKVVRTTIYSIRGLSIKRCPTKVGYQAICDYMHDHAFE